MKKRILILCGVVALLAALSLLPAGAAEPTTQDIDFSAGGTVSAVCPHCKGEAVNWLPLTQAVVDSWGVSGGTVDYPKSRDTHYYVSEDIVSFPKPVELKWDENLCLHLNGNTVKRGGARAFSVTGKLNLMDHAANEGVVQAYAENSSTGCVIRVNEYSGATFRMYGGTVKMLTGDHSRAFKGGSVYVGEGSKCYLFGGTIKNGKACYGGNVYVEGGCLFEMSGGTIADGAAMDGTVSGTSYSGYGGNVFMNYTTASGACTVTITGGTITGGVASDRGGNFYCSAEPNKLNISNATISDGICQTGGGGNLYLNNGYVTITNCTITGGQAQGTSGGNIFTKTGASNANNYTKLIGTTVSGGTAVNYGGNVYSEGKVTIDGNTRLLDGTTGKMGNNMYVTSGGKLTVAATYTGEVSVSFSSSRLSTPIRGGKVTTSATCEGVFTGKLMIENDAQYPTTYAKTGDSTLYINAAAVVKNDGTKIWYDSNASAVAAYDSNTKYLVAMAGNLALNGDYTVDLCGANVAVTGTGNVTLIDTANKDFETYGSATVSGMTVANDVSTIVDGMPYVMIEENGVYTFHCMGVKLSGVSIRPSSSGIYYTGQWNYDEKLEKFVKTFGVAVSLVEMPTETFMNAEHCLYTGYNASELSSGVQKTGAIIEDILDETKTALKNDRRGKMPIYAQAYVTLTDGTVIVGNNGQDESLYSSMTRLDQLIKEDILLSKDYLGTARDFYNKWKDKGMSGWKLKNIPVSEKVEDGKLNLLMMGNSFCYYYVEELYELLMENPPEGITEVNIYNVYHSGASVEDNYNKWLNNEAYYTIFRTNADGRVALTGEYQATIEEALAMEEDWDYIHLHGSASNSGTYATAEESDKHLAIAAKAEPLLNRFHELFPNAQLLWQRTWVSELGRIDGSIVFTEEYSRNYDIGMQFVCDYMCNEFDKTQPYDLIQVNSGASWPIVRAQNAELEESLLPFGGLCARLGLSTYGENLEGYDGVTTHSGDGQHEGDIGGGQMLNAYSWYETLTGKDCRETVYRPVYTYDGTEYTLSEELVTILQNAAHEVVSGMPETVKPAA